MRFIFIVLIINSSLFIAAQVDNQAIPIENKKIEAGRSEVSPNIYVVTRFFEDNELLEIFVGGEKQCSLVISADKSIYFGASRSVSLSVGCKVSLEKRIELSIFRNEEVGLEENIQLIRLGELSYLIERF